MKCTIWLEKLDGTWIEQTPEPLGYTEARELGAKLARSTNRTVEMRDAHGGQPLGKWRGAGKHNREVPGP